MRRGVLGWVAIGFSLFSGGVVLGQSSLDALEEELNEARQQHQDMTSQAMSNFFSQIDAAMGSPDVAMALYQKAGGAMPDPAPVVTQHDDETATEKEERLAQDQANLSSIGAVIQLHCGLMHFAALFVVKPTQEGLQQQWIAWLQTAAQIYPQVRVAVDKRDQKPGAQKRKKDKPDAEPAFDLASFEGQAMHDSAISKFLDFKRWGDAEQGSWAVRDLPRLYRSNVLDPLRASPTSATLAAWDVYIAMMNADEKDNEKWNQVVYPPLEFERACDDYAVTPGTEKLEALVNLIKANPTYPQVDDWIARVHHLMDDYRASRGGKAANLPSPALSPSTSTDPNVTVTTTRQGDMTIIMTHTNSAPISSGPGH